MQTQTLDLSADIIDVRDIIARVEELETEQASDPMAFDNGEELDTLTAIMEELAGMGGDEQWRGDWYPLTLIRNGYFRTYAEELAGDIGAIPKDAGWPMTCIDWEQAANLLRMDYTSVEIEGVTYWTR